MLSDALGFGVARWNLDCCVESSWRVQLKCEAAVQASVKRRRAPRPEIDLPVPSRRQINERRFFGQWKARYNGWKLKDAVVINWFPPETNWFKPQWLSVQRSHFFGYDALPLVDWLLRRETDRRPVSSTAVAAMDAVLAVVARAADEHLVNQARRFLLALRVGLVMPAAQPSGEQGPPSQAVVAAPVQPHAPPPARLHGVLSSLTARELAAAA